MANWASLLRRELSLQQQNRTGQSEPIRSVSSEGPTGEASSLFIASRQFTKHGATNEYNA